MKQYRIKEYPEGKFVIESNTWLFGWGQIIGHNFRGEPCLITYNSVKQAQEGLDLYIERKNFKPRYFKNNS